MQLAVMEVANPTRLGSYGWGQHDTLQQLQSVRGSLLLISTPLHPYTPAFGTISFCLLYHGIGVILFPMSVSEQLEGNSDDIFW